jgi:hypothetical protein
VDLCLFTSSWSHGNDKASACGCARSLPAPRFPTSCLLPLTHHSQFYVDGEWQLDPSKPSETDDQSIANNVLETKDIIPHPVTAAIATVGAGATTAAMAAQVPKETSVPEPETLSVNPIPATAGIGNPIHLKPGEPVPDPSTITSNTVDSTVKTDLESYKKSDALPGGEDSAFTVPPVSKNMIPESSLPMGGSDTFIAGSAAPGSTTAALAGKVPLEGAKVPDVVEESIEKAHVSPEAAANPEAVEEKKEVEDELKSKIPVEPATSGGSTGGIIAGITGMAAAAGTAAMVAAGSAQETATNLATTTSTKATGALSDATEKAKSVAGYQPPTAPGVPEVVTESINEAHLSPEAAANPEAVQEKSAVEGEFLKKVEEKEAAATAAAEKAKEAASSAAAGPSAPAKESVLPVAEPTTPAKADKKSKRKSIMVALRKVFKPEGSA